MSIPLRDGMSAGVLDITTHYFEFIPESEIDSPQPITLTADEIETGKNYFLVPTTAAGLYRYDLRDLVRVAGFYHATPLVEFLGKGSQFASLTGEKLSEYQVTRAVADETARCGIPLPVYSIAPCWDEREPHYSLFIERGIWDDTAFSHVAAAIDAALGQINEEYRSKRASSRLGPLTVTFLKPGTWEQWDRDRLRQTGGTAEQYKHPCLIGDLAFHSVISAKTD
jgi:hypothetical protein